MNTTTNHMRESQVLADGINSLNARRTRRANAAVDFIVGLTVGVLGGLALLHYATPCLGGALC